MVKKGIVVGDLHCGHRVGLTPPEWQIRRPKGASTKRDKWYSIAQALWSEFDRELSKLPPLDFVFSLGDLIEGKGKKSGGTELIAQSIEEQCDISKACFKRIRQQCKKTVKIIGVYGTDYHVSTEGEDWENDIAKDSGFSKIGAHEWVDINGCIFDLKHHITSSSVPHTRFTAVARDQLWNLIWSVRKEQPLARVILRGHAHMFKYAGDADMLAMICPALQGMGSKYGSRRCSGTVDWGFVYFEVDDNGQAEWKSKTKRISAQRSKTIKV